MKKTSRLSAYRKTGYTKLTKKKLMKKKRWKLKKSLSFPISRRNRTTDTRNKTSSALQNACEKLSGAARYMPAETMQRKIYANFSMTLFDPCS